MGKVVLINTQRGEYMFWCEGCDSNHSVTTLVKNEQGAQWGFNGNLDAPTFTPSIVTNKDKPEIMCHSFVTDGKIQYLGDSFHSLKNLTIELTEMEDS